ncbi:sigma-54-dependent transcriptional regulator [Microbulbifer taiwanensis]|uniref:sigma-54-dependent transcriptional regulator n=1 Tax=Microbulbifer taiwanensis TaxID=986746 RepID=UPI00361BFF96
MDEHLASEADECTLEPSGQFQFEHEILQPQLTILWHPQRRLIGARAAVLWDSAGEFEISRWVPMFRLADESEFSLDDRRISRSPLLLKREPNSTLSIHPPLSSMTLAVNGAPLETAMTLSNKSLQAGVTICLGRRVGLYLRLSPPRRAEERDHLGLLGGSYPMAQVRRQVRRIAATNASVLVRGETGTGKELVARALHQFSPRSGREMVSVNMATLGGDLAAAELFGARQGAYTGARGDRPGLIREANGSTLFLDEIGDAPDAVQVMLLRVLEEGRVRPLGDSRDHPVDVRYVAATDRPLEAGAERAFNQPLRRRLEAATVNMPPLRERREDFGELFAAFLAEAEVERGHSIRITADQVCALAARPWPGNVRELRNFVTGLAINSDTDGEIHWNSELAAYLRPRPGNRLPLLRRRPAVASATGTRPR